MSLLVCKKGASDALGDRAPGRRLPPGSTVSSGRARFVVRTAIVARRSDAALCELSSLSSSSLSSSSLSSASLSDSSLSENSTGASSASSAQSCAASKMERSTCRYGTMLEPYTPLSRSARISARRLATGHDTTAQLIAPLTSGQSSSPCRRNACSWRSSASA